MFFKIKLTYSPFKQSEKEPFFYLKRRNVKKTEKSRGKVFDPCNFVSQLI